MKKMRIIIAILFTSVFGLSALGCVTGKDMPAQQQTTTQQSAQPTTQQQATQQQATQQQPATELQPVAEKPVAEQPTAVAEQPTAAPAQQPAVPAQQPAAPVQPAPTGEITEQQAMNIAVADAGLSDSSMQYRLVKRKWDDGRAIYDVEFMSGNVEYEYEILAADGTILSCDYDAKKAVSGTASGNVISMDDARSIAAAKIPGIDASSIYIKYDYDDGKWIYEGKAYFNQTKYEFEIDAYNGQIITWEQEVINKK